MLARTRGESMKILPLIVVTCVLLVAVGARGGEFKTAYYAGTAQGGWSQYTLTAKDGTVATYSYERKPDDDGRVVLELEVKTTGGVAAGSESTMTYTMPKGFDLAKNGISYGKYIEKMMMKYGEMEMPVDDATLEVIRKAEKDYRGAVTFTGAESIGGLACDRYTYAMTTEATKETGTLWLNAAIPFAVVKHAGKVVNADGSVASEFEMTLKDHGQIQLTQAPPEVAPEPGPEPQPLEVGLVEGFKAGRIGIDVQARAGGRELSLGFRNEHEAQLTINIPAGPANIEVDFPVRTLSFNVARTTKLVLEPGTSSEALVVTQRGPRGIADGKCYLSVYEGTPIFQGSVTMDQLPK